MDPDERIAGRFRKGCGVVPPLGEITWALVVESAVPATNPQNISSVWVPVVKLI
jgi:hypothetical protein